MGLRQPYPPWRSQQFLGGLCRTGSRLPRAVLCVLLHTEPCGVAAICTNKIQTFFVFLCVPLCPLWLNLFRRLLQQLPRFLHVFPFGFKVSNRQAQRKLAIKYRAGDENSP